MSEKLKSNVKKVIDYNSTNKNKKFERQQIKWYVFVLRLLVPGTYRDHGVCRGPYDRTSFTLNFRSVSDLIFRV